MKTNKSKIFWGLLAAMLVVLTPMSQVLAGGAGIEPPPDATATIVGPEIWGTVIMYCGGQQVYGFIRTKYVWNCQVHTQAIYYLAWPTGCRSTEDQIFIEPTLPESVEIMAPNGQPYPLDAGGQSISTAKTFITKVKTSESTRLGCLVSF